MQIVKEAGAEYLEAPVSGSKAPAEQGTLIFLCGGDESLFERSAALLDIMGKAKLFLGQVDAQLSQGVLSRFHLGCMHMTLSCCTALMRQPKAVRSRAKDVTRRCRTYLVSYE